MNQACVSSQCVCMTGWGGSTCSVPLIVSSSGVGGDDGGGVLGVPVPVECSGGVVDSNGACCVGVIDVVTGACCGSGDGGGGAVDGLGRCCAGVVDVCGVCGGSGVAVDVTGRCCSSALPPSGVCCVDAVIDSCGVCGGTNSCNTTVSATVSGEWLSAGGSVNAFVIAELLGVSPSLIVDVSFGTSGVSSRRLRRSPDQRRVIVADANTLQEHAVLMPEVGLQPQSSVSWDASARGSPANSVIVRVLDGVTSESAMEAMPNRDSEESPVSVKPAIVPRSQTSPTTSAEDWSQLLVDHQVAPTSASLDSDSGRNTGMTSGLEATPNRRLEVVGVALVEPEETRGEVVRRLQVRCEPVNLRWRRRCQAMKLDGRERGSIGLPLR